MSIFRCWAKTQGYWPAEFCCQESFTVSGPLLPCLQERVESQSCYKLEEGFVVVLLLLQSEWASQWESCCGYGWAGWCIPARESSLPFGVGFKSGCLLQGLRSFFITAQQISLLSAQSCRVTARARQLDLEFQSWGAVSLLFLTPAL